jgi:tetratricopeptide (TPR) repeat protein
VSTRHVAQLLERARAAQAMGRAEDGIAIAARAVALAPGDIRAWCTLGWLQSCCQLFGETLSTAERAIAVDPESEWAHRLRSFALWGLGRYAAATDAAAEAVRLAPEEARALSKFAWYASEVGRGEEAFDVAERAVALHPDDSDCWFSRGWAAWAVKRWEVAEDALTRSRALQPDASHTHNNLGALLARLGRFSEAAACFERALELDPTTPYAYRNLAYCWRSLGRWEEARELVERHGFNKLHAAERQIATAPSSSAYAKRGLSYYLLGRHGEARRDFAEALRRAESHDEAALPVRNLALITLIEGDGSAARTLALRIVSEFSDDESSLAHAGWVAWLVGDQELAVRAADALAAGDFDPVVIAEGRAQAALAQEEWDDARVHLEGALELSRRSRSCCTHAQLGVAYRHLGDGARSDSEFADALRCDPMCVTLKVLSDRGEVELPSY